MSIIWDTFVISLKWGNLCNIFKMGKIMYYLYNGEYYVISLEWENVCNLSKMWKLM